MGTHRRQRVPRAASGLSILGSLLALALGCASAPPPPPPSIFDNIPTTDPNDPSPEPPTGALAAEIAAVASPAPPGEQLLTGGISAYGPVPSPDGTKIAFTWTGRDPEHGSGGFGRSNLRTEILVMDASGKLLTTQSLASGIVSRWLPDGKSVVGSRDGRGVVVSLDGMRLATAPPATEDALRERVTYLASRSAFVSPGEPDAPCPCKPGDLIALAPDEFHFAFANGRHLGVRRVGQSQPVFDLGSSTIYPDLEDFEWYAPPWSPWSSGGSVLALTTMGNDVVVSSPEGERRTIVTNSGADFRAGLAVPSPDGRAVAWVECECVADPRRGGPRVTGARVRVARASKNAKPVTVSDWAEDTVFTLAWLDSRSLVFDRVRTNAFGTGSRILKVTLAPESK